MDQILGSKLKRPLSSPSPKDNYGRTARSYAETHSQHPEKTETLKILPLGFSIAQICFVSYGVSISLSHLLVKIFAHCYHWWNLKREVLGFRSNFIIWKEHVGRNFGNPNSTGHDDPECDMSRAAAEKKQRKVLENSQKKRRVAEAKAEKARQPAAAAAAAKDWPAAPSLSLFDSRQLWFVTKSPRIKVKCSKILDVP